MSWFSKFTNNIINNRNLAILLAFVSSVIPLPGGSFGSLIAVLVTLCKGGYEGSLVFFAVLAATVLNLMFKQSADNQSIFFMVIVLAFLINLLTWLFAVVLQRTGSWRLVIEVGAFFGILSLITLYVIFPHLTSWWETKITLLVNKQQIVSAYGNDLFVNLTGEEKKSLITIMSRYATGFVITSTLLSAWSQILVGRWWQAVMFNPGGLRKELYDIKLGKIAAISFVAVLIFLQLFHGIAADCLSILLLTFAIAGFSLLHALLDRLKKGWFVLGLIYLGVVLTFPIGLAIVAFVALVDVVADFRYRLKSHVI